MLSGKVIKVERNQGNLYIKLKFYNNDKEIKDDDYLIAENGLEKTVLNGYVQDEIRKLKEQLSPTSVKVNDIIEEKEMI